VINFKPFMESQRKGNPFVALKSGTDKTVEPGEWFLEEPTRQRQSNESFVRREWTRGPKEV